MFESWKRKVSQEKGPTEYALSREDFEFDPDRLTTFHHGDLVTRENFASLLSKSFAVSEGNLDMQIQYFYWLRAKYGFDFKKTFHSFLASKGWDALTETEQERLAGAYNQVSAHTKSEDLASIGARFQHQFNEIDDYERTSGVNIPPTADLRATETVAALRTLAEEYTPKKKEDQ